MEKFYRISWIDNLKGIGVIFIIFGHSISCPDFLIDYLFSFHVPLFFFIAGLNFNNNLLSNFKLFFKKRAERLLVPYIFFNILSYVFWIIRVKIMGSPQEVPIIRPLIGILYGNGNNSWLIHNEPLWFFVCLFVAQIFLFFILKIAKTKLQIIVLLFVFAVIGYLDSRYLHTRLPWSIDIAFTAVVFSGIGYIIRGYRWELPKNKLAVCMFAVLLLNLCIAFINGKIDMNYNKYNNIFLFYGGAFSGIIFWIGISRVIGNFSIIKYIGNNSLTIFALHIPALIVIVKLLMMVGIPYTTQEGHIAFLFIHAFLTILAIIPINYLSSKYASFWIGRRNLGEIQT